jgi:sulfite reductase (NADPH) flavoprotein alpha-component
MTISVWRYSHLALAVSSFLLLTLAAVTGIILSFEPVVANFQPFKAADFDQLTLNQTLPVLRKVFPGITELKVNAQGFVAIKGTNRLGEEMMAYVNPANGKILGPTVKQSNFFQWVTALHRSLFLHETGRFFVGLTAFLLLLITISGTLLLIQRQRGLKRFFNSISRDSFAQYYHVMLSRWSLVPILILALSGTYLSLLRFDLLKVDKLSPEVNFDQIRAAPVTKETDFAVFKRLYLHEVESIEFPFSNDVEDYYTLKLKSGELAVNQTTGDILGEVKYPNAVALLELSLNLHTGRANIVWAMILCIASANILFFIYSGFAITLKRRANSMRNSFAATDSKFIILVGSENGSTFGFARAVHQQLLKAGEKSYVCELNEYAVFPKAEHLIVITATYGLGEAPTNAAKFLALIEDHPQQQAVRYAVVGLGSKAYPDFCQFAYEVNRALSQQNWASPLTDIHTINDRSPEEFGSWAETWSQQSGIPLNVVPELYTAESKPLEKLIVINNLPRVVGPGESFTLSLQPGVRVRVTSGDLLAIYPANDHRERLYSIAVINHEIRLDIKLHENGLGSTFLQALRPKDMICAEIIPNKHFHFPSKASEVIMIANGTGVSPFLGMISQNSTAIPCHLYCGFRQRSAFERHQVFLSENQSADKVKRICTAFSREGKNEYVTDLIRKDTGLFADVLNRKGVIMICGSLAMQRDVMELLDTVCQQQMGKSLSYFQSHEQVLTDCY